MEHRNTYIYLLRIISVVLLISIMTGIFAGCGNGNVSAITDDSGENNTATNETGSHSATSNDTALLSDNITIFDGNDADSVNSAIISASANDSDIAITLNTDSSPLSNCSNGDIFFLDGNEDTPIGEPFIGKIKKVESSGKNTVYTVEVPQVDEVFDQLSFNCDRTLNPNEISDVILADGVTLTAVDDVESYLKNESLSDSEANKDSAEYASLTCNNSSSEIKTLKQSEYDGEDLLLNIDLDLKKVFKLATKKQSNEELNLNEQKNTTVYLAKKGTGKCYHRENCKYVKDSTNICALNEAIKKGYSPCRVCTPPVGDGHIDTKAYLRGSFGLKTLHCNIDYDFNTNDGLNSLKLDASGKILGEARLVLDGAFETDSATQKSFLKSHVKVEGLDEKLFPVAFLSFYEPLDISYGTKKFINKTSTMPFTVGLLVYVDIDGDISMTGSAYLNTLTDFDFNLNYSKNSGWEHNFNKEKSDTTIGLDAELTADADLNFGVAIEMYIYNVNICEMNLVKAGSMTEGSVIWGIDSKKAPSDDSYDIDGYSKLYAKYEDLQVKLKAELTLWVLKTSPEFTYSYTARIDKLAEIGERDITRYNPNLMTYSKLTAKDFDAIYYKDTNGNISTEKDGVRKVLYTGEFFDFCGIDDSYLYISKPTESDTYEIYRISKGTGEEEKIAEDIAQTYLMDADYLYYTLASDTKSITRLSRETLKESTLITFDNKRVAFMGTQDEVFYVVTEDVGSILSALFGTYSYCYLVDADGKIIDEYGSNPAVHNYYTYTFDDFYIAVRMESSGYMRSGASEVRWLSKDKKQSIKTECTCGWNYAEEGIFTTIEEDGAYAMICYSAMDGSTKKIANVQNDCALFTLRKFENEWYFFDQTDTDLILYRMNKGFTEQTEIERLSLSDYPYSLSDCNVVIMENRIYFYTMPDAKTSKMLYRYNIV